MSGSASNVGEKASLPDRRARILCVAGYGDDASMFDNLLATPLAKAHDIIPVNLPGFGAPPLDGETTLQTLAIWLAAEASRMGAAVIAAHSVASITASLAANTPDSPITTILSIEGNLVADDAYFSGMAAEFDDPGSFRAVFLARLDEMAKTSEIIARYRRIVSQADPPALWQLGTDARRFSDAHIPGEVLLSSTDATYLYNPDNCPESSLEWLASNPLKRICLDGASHWPSIDRPELLSQAMIEALAT